MSRPTYLILPVACLAIMSGCADLSQHNFNYGRVDLVKAGMSHGDVVAKIGKPAKIIRGEGLRISWQEMVYPKGSIYLYRMRVQKVLQREYYEPEKEKDDWDLANPFREENIFGDAQEDGKKPAISPMGDPRPAETYAEMRKRMQRDNRR